MDSTAAKTKWKLILAGAVCGVAAMILAIFGNPANMAICVACFIRDTAGALKLHSAAPVQYFRPEIVGLIWGSFLVAAGTKEYKSTAGSSPMIRFILGMCTAVGALVFLGCPLRMLLRMSGGDLNAWVALIGFVGGIGVGVLALKKGFSLGRAHETNGPSGIVLPIVMVVALILSLCTALFAASTEGPGSMHAPVIISLICALVFGALAQKSRMCFSGSIRDIFLMKNFDRICILVGIFVVMLIYNIASGHFVFSFAGQPIAHTEALWNILGMFIVGLAAVLAGGCPLRQLILAGQGSADSAIFVVGMFFGAACCHNFGFASSGDGTTPGGRIAAVISIIILLLIGFVGNKRKAEA